MHGYAKRSVLDKTEVGRYDSNFRECDGTCVEHLTNIQILPHISMAVKNRELRITHKYAVLHCLSYSRYGQKPYMCSKPITRSCHHCLV